MSLRRILIANRGEIAARITRTCRKLGIDTVLATSEIDRDSVPARLATRAVCIGPSHPTASYLRPEILVQAARGTGCDAVHPGYGFPVRARRFRASVRAERAGLHRADPRTARRRRRQAGGAHQGAGSRGAGGPGWRGDFGRRGTRAGAAHRPAAAGQGRGRRWWARHETHRALAGPRRRVAACRGGGGRRIRRRARVPGALHRAGAPRRSAGAR